MRFKIVTVGWECADFLERTLHSIASQSFDNYDVMVVDDASEDPRQFERIERWKVEKAYDERWHFLVNARHRGPVFNQAQAIWLLDPADDDVVVWLDLDGDRFAHSRVLESLTQAYADGETLLTYGNYRPEPDHGTCPPAAPYPTEVVVANSYRDWHRRGGGGFNHLRSMKGKVAKAITEADLSWADGRGWYEAGSDYHFMVNGLELAGGRYKCLEEVLCIYNNAQPHPDNVTHPELTNACVMDMLRRPPLDPL